MKKKPLFAIPSFPGSNGEVDNLRTLKRCGFDAFVFRWNDSTEKLNDVDGYFFGAGFSYEDRGRSGMVAARDPLFDYVRDEAARGKVIIGNCNGAQVLVESGLIPLGDKLRMCLARNAIRDDDAWVSPGFLNQWIWMTPSCAPSRCATSDWVDSRVMHIPIAHGEGRFVTRDQGLIEELAANDQIAFRYCDASGGVSSASPVTPNGSVSAIAGICNKEGNVVAIMPHPERTELGDAYFRSIHSWLGRKQHKAQVTRAATLACETEERVPMPLEIFIDTIITNNEERTVEQAARRLVPALRLKQYRYLGLREDRAKELLSSLSFFNPNKERAFVRTQGEFHRWNVEKKKMEKAAQPLLNGIALLRRDEPDTDGLRYGGETGVCYDCSGIDEKCLLRNDVCEVFCNPHSSILERLSV